MNAIRAVDQSVPTFHPQGMRIPDLDAITADPAICGGRPTITGTRVRVSDVLDMLAIGATPATIVADFPYVSESDVRACLMFAARSADHPIVAMA